MKVSLLSALILIAVVRSVAQQKIVYHDSVVHRIRYVDSVIYRYDTIRITRVVRTDTVWVNRPQMPVPTAPKKRGVINPNNWGIGPSVGLYYSPFHGADINIGFGVQYYFLAIPSFRNPHMGHHKKK